MYPSLIDTRLERPGFDIVRAAHAELAVTDLQRSFDFYVTLLGLVVSDRTEDALYLRGYEETDHHCLVLRKAASPSLSHIAFRVRDASDLSGLERHYQKRGCRTRWVENAEVGQPRALRVEDELGFTVEFFSDIDHAERLLRRFDLYRGAHALRIDHFNLFTPDVAKAYEAYRMLGFRCSEYTVTDPPDQKLWAAWMYRKPSVHDVALTNGAGPQLHHVALLVSNAQCILRTCDILAAAGQVSALERGPGRHGISNAFFLYLRDPDGHRIELFCDDYYTGDPDLEPLEWSVNDPRRGTFWGHSAPASWFEEGTVVKDLDDKPVALQAGKLLERPQTVT
jgi:catechol 2,3-dioxygenase